MAAYPYACNDHAAPELRIEPLVEKLHEVQLREVDRTARSETLAAVALGAVLSLVVWWAVYYLGQHR